MVAGLPEVTSRRTGMAHPVLARRALQSSDSARSSNATFRIVAGSRTLTGTPCSAQIRMTHSRTALEMSSLGRLRRFAAGPSPRGSSRGAAARLATLVLEPSHGRPRQLQQRDLRLPVRLDHLGD